MDGLNPLMRYALSRGEGLLPQLREAFALHHLHAANVIDLAAFAGRPAQAGSNPVSALPLDLPSNVIPFRPATAAKTHYTPAKTARTPRKSRATRLLNRKD